MKFGQRMEAIAARNGALGAPIVIPSWLYFREEDFRGSSGFELLFCHTKLGQRVKMLHSMRQDVKSHHYLNTSGQCCRTKAYTESDTISPNLS